MFKSRNPSSLEAIFDIFKYNDNKEECRNPSSLEAIFDEITGEVKIHPISRNPSSLEAIFDYRSCYLRHQRRS